MRTRTCTTTLFNKKCGGSENIYRSGCTFHYYCAASRDSSSARDCIRITKQFVADQADFGPELVSFRIFALYNFQRIVRTPIVMKSSNYKFLLKLTRRDCGLELFT
jgi:hypothetical protein